MHANASQVAQQTLPRATMTDICQNPPCSTHARSRSTQQQIKRLTKKVTGTQTTSTCLQSERCHHSSSEHRCQGCGDSGLRSLARLCAAWTTLGSDTCTWHDMTWQGSNGYMYSTCCGRLSDHWYVASAVIRCVPWTRICGHWARLSCLYLLSCIPSPA